MRIHLYTFLLTALVWTSLSAETTTLEIKQANETQAAHGLKAWWAQEVVSADVQIVFGGNLILDGTFTYQAHGPKARYDRQDGVTIYYDGETAWVHPADAEVPRGRFHVLTWPWFILAPFKVQGDGIHLSDYQMAEVDGQSYVTMLQTFGENVGDTPDDWYRFYIDPDTDLIEAMSYIVTYGKDLEEANEQASIIKYFDYEDYAGTLISTRYEFWYWDQDTHTVQGDAPKGTGTVSHYKYLSADEADFTVPADARELPLP